MNPLSLLLKPVTDIASSVINARAEKEKARIALKAQQVQTASDNIKAKVEAQAEITKQDFELAHSAIGDWSKSWKDEIVLLTVILPLFTYFLFGLTGWINLKDAADAMIAAFSGDTYYAHVVGAIFMAIYGIGKLRSK